jgi:hypothetical protein
VSWLPLVCFSCWSVHSTSSVHWVLWLHTTRCFKEQSTWIGKLIKPLDCILKLARFLKIRMT